MSGGCEDEARCERCRHVWPLEFFYVTRGGETTRSDYCARCRRLQIGERFDSLASVRVLEALVR